MFNWTRRSHPEAFWNITAMKTLTKNSKEKLYDRVHFYKVVGSKSTVLRYLKSQRAVFIFLLIIQKHLIICSDKYISIYILNKYQIFYMSVIKLKQTNNALLEQQVLLVFLFKQQIHLILLFLEIFQKRFLSNAISVFVKSTSV